MLELFGRAEDLVRHPDREHDADDAQRRQHGDQLEREQRRRDGASTTMVHGLPTEPVASGVLPPAQPSESRPPQMSLPAVRLFNRWERSRGPEPAALAAAQQPAVADHGSRRLVDHQRDRSRIVELSADLRA